MLEAGKLGGEVVVRWLRVGGPDGERGDRVEPRQFGFDAHLVIQNARHHVWVVQRSDGHLVEIVIVFDRVEGRPAPVAESSRDCRRRSKGGGCAPRPVKIRGAHSDQCRPHVPERLLAHSTVAKVGRQEQPRFLVRRRQRAVVDIVTASIFIRAASAAASAAIEILRCGLDPIPHGAALATARVERRRSSRWRRGVLGSFHGDICRFFPHLS
jgi:hypothetical protein